MRMKKIPRWLIIVIAIVLATIALKVTVFRKKPAEVRVARIEKGLVEETVSNTRAGTVKARERSKLSPQIGGRVIALPYKKGSLVPAGALLLKMDDSVQKAALQVAEHELSTARAKLAEARAASELAESDWKRSVNLARQGIVSEQDLDTLKSRKVQTAAAVKAAEALVEQSLSNVKLARAQFELTEIRAPFSGVLADTSTEVGEWITPSPPGVPIPPILDVLSPKSLYVSAPIDEVDSVRVMPGQEVRITVDSVKGRTFKGKVTRVAPYVKDIQDQNRTVEIEADFMNPEDAAKILPGTSADIEIVLTSKKNALRVPTAAVGEGGKVFVVEKGRLVERPIKTGLRNWRYTEVTEGLEEGDLVVTEKSSAAVEEGARVKPSIEP